MVGAAWKSNLTAGVPTKIAGTLNSLSDWARDVFGNTKKRLANAEKKLAELENCKPDAAILDQCAMVSAEINDLRNAQESYWNIRAKANELNNGDKNTSYFHHKASSRRKRNTIRGIMDTENN